MATARQHAAYKAIKDTQHREHQIKTYGMVPIGARFPGTCGCGRVHPAGTRLSFSWTADKDTPCAFNPKDRIVKFRGAWWNVACVERVQQEEFRATCKYVLEEKTRKGWWAKGWTNDAKQAQTWRELAAMIEDEELAERVIER